MQGRRNNFSAINPLRLILIIGTYFSIVLASGIDLGELSDLYEVIPTSKFTVDDLVASLEVKKETKKKEDLSLLSGEIKYGEVKKKKKDDESGKETKEIKTDPKRTKPSKDIKDDDTHELKKSKNLLSNKTKNEKVSETSDALLNGKGQKDNKSEEKNNPTSNETEKNKESEDILNEGSKKDKISVNSKAENDEISKNKTRDKSLSGEIEKNELKSNKVKTKSEKNIEVKKELSEEKPKEKAENKGSSHLTFIKLFTSVGPFIDVKLI